MSDDRDDTTGTDDASASPPDWAPEAVPLLRGGMDRVRVLLETRRYADAEKELRRQLGVNPNDAVLHMLLSHALGAQEKHLEATQEAQLAIGLDPLEAGAYHALASSLLHRDRPDEALQAIGEALRLNPWDADYHGLKGAALIEKRDWPAALAAADEGLRCDPENDGCRNLRAMALRQLGRRDEAQATIRDQLRKSPDDAFTHANQGWSELFAGDHRKALEHFREALRLDPNLDYAREGILEALKAKNPIYRVLLKWKLWMSTLSGRAQWAVIIGLYVVYRIVRGLARSNPELQPILYPVIGLYVGFVLLTWLGDPIFDSLLRLNRFGRLALTDDRRRASNLLIGALALLAIGGAVAWGTGEIKWLLPVGVLALVTLPATKIYACAPGWPRLTLTLYVAGLGLVGLAGSLMVVLSPGGLEEASPLALGLLILYALGLFGSWILVNVLVAATPKR